MVFGDIGSDSQMGSTSQYWLRWLLLVPLVTIASLATSVIAGFISEALLVWFEPVIGVVAAITVVLTSYTLAPEFKLAVATVALFSGAAVAWALISPPSFYPGGRTEVYELTYLPIVLTYFAGIVTWCVCFAWSKKTGRRHH